jgi:hypothetical protein
MTDASTTLTTDPQARTTEAAPGVPTPAAPPLDFTTELPQGVHPRDSSVPIVPGQPLDADSIAAEGNLGPQGHRTSAPWGTSNEEAFPVNQRAASQWSANQYTLGATPIQLAGKLRGRTSVIIWVPASASHGCVVAPEEGDITQGAGITLSPGDSIELPTEGAVWAGVIVGQTTGTVYVVQLFNPPGGGLGLSAS